MNVKPESSLTVVVKKREANEKAPQKVSIKAFIEYANLEETISEFEKMREYLVSKGQAKAVLFFHNEENNSYLSLFTQGLGKPADLSEKQFEDKLLRDFRNVNPNVIQVNVYHVAYNDSYVGRVYLRSEQDGKDFIVDYTSKRKDIFKNYKENGSITFNINVDIKTLRKIKLAEKKARETEDKIKKQSELNRRELRRPQNGYPLNAMPPMAIGANMVLPPMNAPGLGLGPMQMPMGLGGFNPSVTGMKPPGPFINPITGLNPLNPVNPMANTPDQMRQRIKHILKDKANFITAGTESTKRVVSDPLRFLIEEAGIPTGQSGALLNLILAEESIENIFKYIESPVELQNKLSAIKH